jgi:hypothetical protein
MDEDIFLTCLYPNRLNSHLYCKDPPYNSADDPPTSERFKQVRLPSITRLQFQTHGVWLDRRASGPARGKLTAWSASASVQSPSQTCNMDRVSVCTLLLGKEHVRRSTVPEKSAVLLRRPPSQSGCFSNKCSHRVIGAISKCKVIL